MQFLQIIDFLEFLSQKIFLLLFAKFELMFHNNTVKISEKLKKRNLLKICLQVTYLKTSAQFASFLLWEKVKIFDFLKTND